MVKIKKDENKKRRLPTIEEMLSYVPKRAEFAWETDEQGLVQIKVPKFTGNFGKSFLKLIKKNDTFSANLDKIGSVVWKNSDGKNTVSNILEILKKEFPDQENIDHRLFLFLQQMQSMNYLVLLSS